MTSGWSMIFRIFQNGKSSGVSGNSVIDFNHVKNEQADSSWNWNFVRDERVRRQRIMECQKQKK